MARAWQGHGKGRGSLVSGSDSVRLEVDEFREAVLRWGYSA